MAINYDANFFPNPLPLLQRASIYLPDRSYQDPRPAAPPLNPINDGSNFATMRRQLWAAIPINTGIDVLEEAVRQTKWVLSPVQRAGHTAYFLPWHDIGCATEMTLPNPPLANYFFTSALAGCSVIVTGTPQAPRIYHCGIDAARWGTGGRPAKPVAGPGPGPHTVPEFWRALVNHIEANHQLAPARPIIGEVNTELYVKDPATTYQHPSAPVGTLAETTADAVDCMDNMVHDDYVTMRGNARIQGGEAHPWGVFFGLYDAVAGQWNFYLQQNLVISHEGRYLTGLFKAIRRSMFSVNTRTFSQSLPWRIRHVHVVPLPVPPPPAVAPVPVYTARNWVWDDVKDGNLWLP